MVFLVSKAEIDSPQNQQQPVVEKQQIPNEPVKQIAANPVQQHVPVWISNTRKDQLTDEVINISSLQSANTVNLKFPYDGEQRATLSLVEQAGKVDVIFQIEKGQLFPGTLAIGTTRANIRIDDKSINSIVRGSSGYATELCFLMAEELPFLIRNGNEMRIEVELFQESNMVFVFDLTSGR